MGSIAYILTLYVSSISPKIEIPDSANVLLSYRGKKKYKTSPIHKEMRSFTKNQYPLKTWTIIIAFSDKISSKASTLHFYCRVNLLKGLYGEKLYSSFKYETCLRVASWHYGIFLLACSLVILISPDAIFIWPWRSIKCQQTQNSWVFSTTMLIQVSDAIYCSVLL